MIAAGASLTIHLARSGARLSATATASESLGKERLGPWESDAMTCASPSFTNASASRRERERRAASTREWARHLHQHVAPYELREPLRIVLKARVPLRVGEQHADPAGREQLEDAPLEVRRQRRVWRLQQELVPRWP